MGRNFNLLCTSKRFEMTRILMSGLFLVLLMAGSCKNKNTSIENAEESTSKEETVKQLPDDFLTFYDRFGKDSMFQIEHIMFPLDGERALEDGEKSADTSVKWRKEDWKFQKTFDDMGGSFKQEFIDFHGIITEVTHDHTATYIMTRRFSKIGEEWMLIYYQEMGLH